VLSKVKVEKKKRGQSKLSNYFVIASKVVLKAVAKITSIRIVSGDERIQNIVIVDMKVINTVR